MVGIVTQPTLSPDGTVNLTAEESSDSWQEIKESLTLSPEVTVHSDIKVNFTQLTLSLV